MDKKSSCFITSGYFYLTASSPYGSVIALTGLVFSITKALAEQTVNIYGKSEPDTEVK